MSLTRKGEVNDLYPKRVYKVHTWDDPKQGVVYVIALTMMDALAAAKREGVLALGTYLGSQAATQDLLLACGLYTQVYPSLIGGKNA